LYSTKTTLLLDMNSTFMFGEDRFSVDGDYSLIYQEMGGSLSRQVVNKIIRSAYSYLDERYPDLNYRHDFPSLAKAITCVTEYELTEQELENIIATFAYHEIGNIPDEYIDALYELHKKFQLAVVIDIWAPKKYWLDLFEKLEISGLFSASSFSSDHGMVKPSPKPFELVIDRLGITKNEALVVGDSVRRDLGGARSAGIDCVLVGGSKDLNALESYENLLEFCKAVC